MNKQFSIKFFQLLSLLIISGFIGYYIGTNKIRVEWKNFKPIAHITPKNPPPSQTLDMTLFYSVLDKVNKDYYDKEKIDAGKILNGAVSGMLQSLGDPYTSFFPPSENSSFKTQLSGQFEGIGAELGMSQDNKITVISPLDNSPAQKAGVLSGDIIVKVDGKETIGWTLPQAVEKIRGPKGTNVVLAILHANAKNSVDITIARDVIVVKSVVGWLKQVDCKDGSCKAQEVCPTCKSVMYLRLSQFGDKTNDEWKNLVKSLNGQSKKVKNFKGMVLDLRNNPGGYLSDAVFIASEFLDSGVVVVQEANGSDRQAMRVSGKGILTSYPLIVLVNKGSASASEIVAAALHDNGRAKLVGEKTFGKGTIQEAVELGNGASVHISIAKWLTPNGTWVDKQGIEPDITVSLEASPSSELKVDNKEFDKQLQRAIGELVK